MNQNRIMFFKYQACNSRRLAMFLTRMYACSNKHMLLRENTHGILIINDDNHCKFMVLKNTTKSLSNIWESFSSILDVGIAKICKQFNSLVGFLTPFWGQHKTGQKSAAEWAELAVLSILQEPQKLLLWEFNLLDYLGNSLIK